MLDTLFSPDTKDCLAALASLPEPLQVWSQDGQYLAKISEDHWCIVAADDDRYPEWAFDAVPHTQEWGLAFESAGRALLVHFTPHN